ncbi:glycosyltransferase family 2 protein [bacterium]|nr:glycosyltransferase family 2 protein [bacterium]
MESNLSHSSEPQVAVIIVSFNSRDDVLECLAALEDDIASELVEVIVVDNGSNDDSPAAIASQFPAVKLIALQENLGFASACNVGIQNSCAPSILLLNPDTKVRPGAIASLHEALAAHPDWGIVGPRMVDQHGHSYCAARTLPTVWRLITETLTLYRLFPHSALFNSYLYGDVNLDNLDRVEQIEGSALMISQRARAQVGNLDSRFFIYFEEVDWCKRVADAGFEIHVVKDAEVMHRRSTTMSKFFIFSRQARAQSAMNYFLKHHGKFGLFKLRAAMSAALLIRALLLFPLVATGRQRHRTKIAATFAEWREFTRGIHA